MLEVQFKFENIIVTAGDTEITGQWNYRHFDHVPYLHDLWRHVPNTVCKKMYPYTWKRGNNVRMWQVSVTSKCLVIPRILIPNIIQFHTISTIKITCIWTCGGPTYICNRCMQMLWMCHFRNWTPHLTFKWL